MTAPALAATRFAMALGVGAALGLIYGFLRPLGPRLNWLRDSVFVLCALFGWVYLGFGLCQGDLRFGYTAGAILGAFLWELTAGTLLRPVFSGFWKFLALFLVPFKKISVFLQIFSKKLFAKCKKWVTMGWNICRNTQRRNASGGTAHGKAQISFGFQDPIRFHECFYLNYVNVSFPLCLMSPLL